MEEEYDPYLVAFDNIQDDANNIFQNNFIKEDEIMLNEYENHNQMNEDEEMKDANDLGKNEQNLINDSDKNLINKNPDIINKDINMTVIDNTNAINKINESSNTINMIIPKRINNYGNEIRQKYEYDYSIICLNEGESGLMEDYINEGNVQSTTRDCFNFQMDEKKWIKFLNHSIFVHYDKNLKEYTEKLQKMRQYMINNNGNINMAGNLSVFPFMVNYGQNMNMNINNLKNMK